MPSHRFSIATLAALMCLSPFAIAAQDHRLITGEVMILERLALPDHAILMVEVSDAQDHAVAALRVALEGTQSPFAFEVTAPDAARYLRAGVSAGDAMVWLTAPIKLSNAADTAALGSLRAARTANMGATRLIDCGDTLAEFGILAEQARLRLDQTVLQLAPRPAASGVYYETPDNPANSLHLKESLATIRIDGAEHIDCQLLTSEHDLANLVWTIRSVDGEAPIVPERTELVFLPDGRFAATMGCNRFVGSYRSHGGFLLFGHAASTMMACPDPLAKQERDFARMLDRVDGYTLSPQGDELTLKALGQPVLTAQRTLP